jgi:hypothetical protein
MKGSLPFRTGETTGTSVEIDLGAAYRAVDAFGRTLQIEPAVQGNYGSEAAVAARKPAGAILDGLVAYISTNIQELLTKLGGPEQVAAMAQLAYRTYVAPINIQQIPDFIEPAFDSYMELIVGKLALKLARHPAPATT